MTDSRPTIDDVAREAQVSRSTVSRVLNADTAVSDRARAATERAMAELGYVPDPAARRLGAMSAKVEPDSASA